MALIKYVRTPELNSKHIGKSVAIVTNMIKAESRITKWVSLSTCDGFLFHYRLTIIEYILIIIYYNIQES